MTAEGAETRLARLSEAGERVADALLELELDGTRELLDKATLRGTTAAGWQTTSTALAAAWEDKSALDGVLERARSLRGGRSRLRADRARASLELLLDSPIEVAGRPDARCTPRQLIERIDLACREGRAFVDAVSRAWDAFVPQLSAANATLRACAELLEDLGTPPPPELHAARGEVARLTDEVSGDPLSVAPTALDALEAAVAALRADAERVRDFRADAGRRMTAARGLLDEVRAAADDARAAHRAALEKIAGVEAPTPTVAPHELAAALRQVEALTRADGAWRAASDALERWTARARALRDDAVRAAAASRAPIRERDELRGLLTAYQAKAQRLRMLEDPLVARLFERAHGALHAAPTDVRAARLLIGEYQRAVSGARAPHEPEVST